MTNPLRYFKPLSLLLACFAISGCYEKPQVTAIPIAHPNGPILVVGDGFAAGKGLLKGEMAFPELLERRLTDLQQPREVINLSAEGITTEDALMLVSTAINKYEPSNIIIALGYADVHRKRDPKTIHHNLAFMAQMGKQKAVRIIICGFGSNPIYRQLQREEETIVVPDYLRNIKGDPYYTSELRPPYPNQVGHEMLLETIWSVIKGDLFSDSL